MRPELIRQRDPVGDQVLPGPHRRSEHDRGRGVGDERAQPGPVGAQRVSEHEGVEPIVLVPGRATATAQAVDLVGADHHNGEPGLKEGVDDLAVAAFDRDLADPGAAQPAHELAQPSAGGVDEELLGDPAPVVDDSHSVIRGGPVQAGGDITGRELRQNRRCRWRGGGAGRGGGHVVLLQLSRAPVGRVLDRGSRIAHCSALLWRSALVDGPRDPGDHQVPRSKGGRRRSASAYQGGDPVAPRVHRRQRTPPTNAKGGPVSDPGDTPTSRSRRWWRATAARRTGHVVRAQQIAVGPPAVRPHVWIDRVRWSRCGAPTWSEPVETAPNGVQLLHLDLRRVCFRRSTGLPGHAGGQGVERSSVIVDQFPDLQEWRGSVWCES